MRRITALAITVMASLLYVSGVQAQQTPNFSGKWTLIPGAVPTTTTARRPIDPATKSNDSPATTGRAPRQGRNGGGFSCLESCTITQTGTTLTIQQHLAGAAPTDVPHTIVLPLDGAEAKDIRAEPGESTNLTSMTKARWEKSTLLVSRIIGSGIARNEQVISLDQGELTIVTRTWIAGTDYGSDGPRSITFKYRKQ